MAELSDRKMMIKVLLQEQQQLRAEVRMFDGHIIRVLGIYLAAIMTAFGWLAKYSIEQARTLQQGASGLTFDAAMQIVLSELAVGPLFYFFAGIPFLTLLILLFVMRDLASLNERFLLLKQVADKIVDVLSLPETETKNILLLDRGLHTSGRRMRSLVEWILVIAWLGTLTTLWVFLLIFTCCHLHASVSRWVVWIIGWVSVGVIVIAVALGLIVFLSRRYAPSGILWLKRR